MGIAFRFQPSYNFLIKQKSKYVDISEQWKGIDIMTENEKELIKMIRETDNPGQALLTAGVIIIGFLKQLESSEVQESAVLREYA